MEKAIIGEKKGMTQIFDSEGKAIPVTVIEAKSNYVIQRKTKETDGYEAVQLGYKELKESRVNKPKEGHCKKANVKTQKYLREFCLDNSQDYEPGQEIKVDSFKEGEYVDITGTSKGKGFAGSIKRWNFSRGPMTHGSKYHRGPGAMGSTDPARVFKGRKLPGRKGGDRVTVQNMKIVKVDPEKNVILVKGAVPGINNSLLLIKDSLKK